MENGIISSTPAEPERVGPPAKRPRLDAESDQQPKPITHDSDVWFADGNVVIFCKDTGFRVHSGVLSLHCQIFKDMLSAALPSAGEMYEGVDVIRLSDTVSSMRLFLSALYFRTKGPMRAKLSINELMRLLELSKKYMADGLQQEVSEHLRILYPLDVSAYTSDRRKFLLPSDRRFNHYDAVLIADRHDLPIILPCALYLASAKGLQHLLDTPKVPSTVARRIHLFRDALDQCITDLMIDGGWFAVEACADDASSGEDDVAIGCAGATFAVQQRAARAYRTLAFDIFADYKIDASGNLCSACQKERTNDHKRLQELIWNSLPTLCSSDWHGRYDVRKAQSAIDRPQPAASAPEASSSTT